jgi:hypothetical protein
MFPEHISTYMYKTRKICLFVTIINPLTNAIKCLMLLIAIKKMECFQFTLSLITLLIVNSLYEKISA